MVVMAKVLGEGGEVVMEEAVKHVKAMICDRNDEEMDKFLIMMTEPGAQDEEGLKEMVGCKLTYVVLVNALLEFVKKKCDDDAER